MKSNNCRFCNTPLTMVFADLSSSPLANSFVDKSSINDETFYPLCAYVCNNCLLVQVTEYENPDNIFADYAYFSSYSESWLKHAEEYVNMIVHRFGLDKDSQVIEIASNDGYLLQYFKKKGIPILGIEPARNVAEVAKKNGIPTITKFFGKDTARELEEEGKKADLLLGNNVLAHVPNLNNFVEGLKILLKPNGIITMEFPHLLKLIAENQFDTIYHEHFSYFSFITVQQVFASHELTIFDVEELSTHGGSLRIYAKHKENNTIPVNDRIYEMIRKEKEFGLGDVAIYSNFQKQVEASKKNIREFFINAKNSTKKVVGYGAPAKGNTLLNYCGIGTEFMEYTVDLNPNKQGLYLPGTHIPIKSPTKITETKPDYLVILPWNLKDEIMNQMRHIRQWNGKFVVLIPEVKIYS